MKSLTAPASVSIFVLATRAREVTVATLTIRNVDDEVHAFLRRRAAAHGRSMEAELRALLDARMKEEWRSPAAVAQSVRARFAALDGSELAAPDRPPLPDPPDVDA